MINVVVLGSTGSIGLNALEVIGKMNCRFSVSGLAAGRNIRRVQEQIELFRPEIVSVERKEDADELKSLFGKAGPRITYGQEGAVEVASFEKADTVLSAITGIAGLKPTLAAVKEGKNIALANKESMVVAGGIIRSLSAETGATIIPVDSEHSGVFQCLSGERLENVKKVILTASGGPFFQSSIDELKQKTLEDALQHPRWKMGKKVTIDSATLMNKGLELIEARWLFALEPEQLDVLIHPQSIVHSLVEMRDGSMLAQLSPTDMKIPIQYALTYPEREDSLLESLNLSRVRSLEFHEVDAEKFPLLGLAKEVMKKGKSYPVALNAANEIVISAFLRKRIKFFEISSLVIEVINLHREYDICSVEDIFSVDRETREQTRNILKKRC